MIDIHSHILPSIDDGAKDVDESIKLLRMMKKQGITTVIATPHFYRQEQDAEEFIEKRNNAYNLLTEKIAETGEDLPKIVLGAEVYFTTSLVDCDISKLCIENTDYFILELPYQNFTDILERQINTFINGCPKTPILAHVERYFRFTSPDKIYNMISYGVLAQMNTSSLLHRDSRRACVKLIKDGRVHTIGTDTHNPDTRPSSMEFGKKFIEKKFGKGCFEYLQQNNRLVLDNADYDEII